MFRRRSMLFRPGSIVYCPGRAALCTRGALPHEAEDAAANWRAEARDRPGSVSLIQSAVPAACCGNENGDATGTPVAWCSGETRREERRRHDGEWRWRGEGWWQGARVGQAAIAERLPRLPAGADAPAAAGDRHLARYLRAPRLR